MLLTDFYDPVFVKALSPRAQEVLSLIADPCDEYQNKYSTSQPVRKYIADFLGLSARETRMVYHELEINYIKYIDWVAMGHNRKYEKTLKNLHQSY